MRGRIEGTDVYLDEDQLPAFSLSVNSLTDPSKIKGTSSTTLRVLSTPESRRALGTHFMDERRRTKRPVLRIGEDSVDLFRSEVVAIRNNRDAIEAYALSGNASWFEYAKNLDLKTFRFGLGPVVDFNSIDEAYAQSNIVIWPLIDYGSFAGQGADHDIAIEKMRPAVRIGKLIERLLGEAGYRVKAEGIRAANDWDKFIVQSSTEDALVLGLANEAPGATLTLPDFQTVAADPGYPGDVLYTMPVDALTTPPVSFFYFLSGSPSGSPGWLGGARKYVMPENGVLHVLNCRWPFMLNSTSIGPGEQYKLIMWDATDGVRLGELSYVTTGEEIVMPGEGTYIFIRGDFPPAYVPEGHDVVWGFFSTETSSENEGFPCFPSNWAGSYDVAYVRPLRPYQEDCELIIESIVPDGSLMDQIKGLCIAQNLIPITNTSRMEVAFWAYEEYFGRPSTKARTRDWTSRLDQTSPPTVIDSSTPVSVALRFKRDDKDSELQRLYRLSGGRFADYVGSVPGGWDKPMEIEVPYAPSYMDSILGGCLVPVIHEEDGEPGEDSYDIEDRLLVFDGMVPGTWRLDGNDLSLYPKIYFLRPTGEEAVPLAFGNPTIMGGLQPVVSDTQWDTRLRGIRARALECYLLLRDHELRNFHHGIPTLVDDGSGPRWYYVQEIFQHKFGKNIPTKCILVEIPGALDLRGDLRNPALTYPPVNPEPEITLGFFTIDLTHGLLYTVQGVTFVCVLHAGAFSPGSDPVGEFSPNPTYGVVLQQGSDLYALVLNPSPVGPGYDVTNELTFDATNGLMVTIASTTYQADIIQL